MEGDVVSVWGDPATVAVLAFALTLAATPLAAHLARRTGWLDRPAEHKPDRPPMPLLGGLALAVGAAVPAMFALRHEAPPFAPALAAGAAWMLVCGLIDDRIGLSPRLKLAVQATAAVALYAGGVSVLLPLPDWANFLLTILWLVGVTNAMNLLDNMDGLAAGTAAVVATCFAALAAYNGQMTTAALAAGIAAASLGFLVHNFPPARIFLGDAGSLPLGLALAVLGIELRFPDNVNTVTWMVPVLALGVPLTDTAFVTVTRWRRGLDPLASPGCDHISHRLRRSGWSDRRVALGLPAASGLLAAVAAVVSLSRAALAYGLAVAAFASAAVLATWIGARTEAHDGSGEEAS